MNANLEKYFVYSVIVSTIAGIFFLMVRDHNQAERIAVLEGKLDEAIPYIAKKFENHDDDKEFIDKLFKAFTDDYKYLKDQSQINAAFRTDHELRMRSLEKSVKNINEIINAVFNHPIFRKY